MTKEELKKYLWLRRVIKQLEDRREELETEATRVTTRLSNMPKGGLTRTMEDIVADMVEVDEKIQNNIRDGYRAMCEIEEAIESLPEREQYLMRARYIQGKSWEQIAVDMHYSWQHVHRIHANALRLLEKM